MQKLLKAAYELMIAANVRCMNLQLSVESILREFELNSEKLYDNENLKGSNGSKSSKLLGKTILNGS